MPYYEIMPDFEGEGIAEVTRGANIKRPFNNWLTPSPWTEPVPEPLQLTVKEQGELLPFYELPIPIMKKSLLQSLRDAGVDNIDDYAVEITNPFDGTVNNDYRAINIIGAIKAIDEGLPTGEELDESGSGLAGKFYDEIILDEKKINGQLLFQLEESLSCIVVAESIKELIESLEDPKCFIFKPLFEVDDDDDEEEEDDDEWGFH
jgi:hypothetical protein